MIKSLETINKSLETINKSLETIKEHDGPKGLAMADVHQWSTDSDSSAAAPAAAEAAPDRQVLDPAVAALCAPITEADPCGPALDLDGDADYLNFFAHVEGTLPTNFFSLEDGKPFDPSTIDIDGQLASLKALLTRTRDIRLLVAQARLSILNRNLAGFATNLAAIAEWLDKFWDAVHPRPQNGDLNARLLSILALDLPTVIFPLQYAPLVGSITYRAWMIAKGEAKLRPGDPVLDVAAIAKALQDAPPAKLAAAHKQVTLIDTSLGAIRNAFLMRGSSAGLQSISALVDKMRAFIDQYAGAPAPMEAAAAVVESGDASRAQKDTLPAPASTVEATDALAAIADYYSHSEPSSPALPLVRQAHQLVGKSFLEVMTVLVPSQVDKAAFQIGTDQVFELPVGKLTAGLATTASAPAHANGAGEEAPPEQGRPRYRVQSRSQAIALLEQVQQYFHRSEPSSPVPMLCQRAGALAERDFMNVLRDVLPKSALKNINMDK
jgi:type VI secretion system protein ImpA